MTRERRIQMLKSIYRTLPGLKCKGLCQECCGPVCMTSLERDRVERHIGRTPELTESLVCPVLKDGKCSAYSVRPLVCRLWGLVEAMRCPHGCEPERWVTDDEAYALLDAVKSIGGDTVVFGLDAADTAILVRHLQVWIAVIKL
jgi:Fe-S-cluster containining protein